MSNTKRPILTWPEIKFPPINLWTMAKLNTPYLDDTSGHVIVDPSYWQPNLTPRQGGFEQADQRTMQVGTKYDQDKPRMDLLDPLALEGLAAVLTFGAKKYAAHNWRGGLSYSRLIAALLRHTFAILRGERIDPESNLPHVDHVGCCWMFLSNMMKTRLDMDDLHEHKESGAG